MQERALAGESTELFHTGALRFLVQVGKPTQGYKILAFYWILSLAILCFQ